MPRVKTPQGVKEFSYTPGGMAAARQAAADQLVTPGDPTGDTAKRTAGGAASGALSGALTGAALGMSGGPLAPLTVPVAAGYGAIAGGIAGAGMGAAGSTPEQVQQVGSTAEMLASEGNRTDARQWIESIDGVLGSDREVQAVLRSIGG